MKKMKAVLALVLVLCLFVTLFAACAKTEEPAKTENETKTENKTETKTGEPAANDDKDEEPEEPEELVDITMVYFDLNMKADGCEDVVKAMNAITEPSIGVTLDLVPIGLGDWATKVGLMLSGGEKVDIIGGLLSMGAVSYNTLKNNNQLLDISEYLKEDYCSNIMANVGHLMGPFTDNGKIYGFPSKRDTAAAHNIVMRKDILEELGLLEKAENLTTWAEYEEIVEAFKEAYEGTGMYAITNSDGNSVIGPNGWACTTVATRGAFDVGEFYDTLGDNTGMVCADFDGKVSLLPEHESTIDHYKMVADWMDRGLLYPDAAFTEATGRTLMKDGIGFSSTVNGEGQLANDFKGATGYDVVCVPIYPTLVTTSATMSWGQMIPINCEEPEKALQFIDMLFSDKELINLLTYGIQGEDYTLNEKQEAVFDVGSMKWKGSDWLVGNMFLTWPQVGTGTDYRDRRLEIVNAQEVSPFNGFRADTADLQLVISQITAVTDQFTKTLACGGYTDEIYQEYLSKLEVAGVQDYLDATQKQLDAWLAAN